ncbi:heparinase, partial [Thioclava sp. BHET1]
LALKSGELWVFRHDGHSTLDLQASVYLEKGRMKPRATKQIVLSATVRDYARQIRWTLSKAQVTPLAIRDLESVEAAPE